MTPEDNRRATLPTPAPLDVEWEYNGDFHEIGYYEHILDDEAEDGYRTGEWIVLAQVNLGCTLDPEAEETWRIVHQIGCLMMSAPRMKAALAQVKAMMDADPSSFSFKERYDVDSALSHAPHEAENWSRG